MTLKGVRLNAIKVEPYWNVNQNGKQISDEHIH